VAFARVSLATNARALFPYNGEQPKYFMLNLVYAAGVIETPTGISGDPAGGRRYDAQPLRSGAKHNICELIYHSTLHLPWLFSLSHRGAFASHFET